MRKEDMVTKKDFYNAIIEKMKGKGEEYFFSKGERTFTYVDAVAFLENEVNLIAKKAASKSNKPTKTQKENEKLKTVILEEVLSDGKFHTIKEMTATDTAINGLSTSKMSALLTQLRKDNKIIREYDKKTPIYKIIIIE